MFLIRKASVAGTCVGYAMLCYAMVAGMCVGSLAAFLELPLPIVQQAGPPPTDHSPAATLPLPRSSTLLSSCYSPPATLLLLLSSCYSPSVPRTRGGHARALASPQVGDRLLSFYTNKDRSATKVKLRLLLDPFSTGGQHWVEVMRLL